MNVSVKLGHSDAAIRGPGGQLAFNLTHGTFTISAVDGTVAILEATARVVLGDMSHALTAGYRRTAESVEVTGPFGPGMAVRVTCEPEGTGPRLVFTATCHEELAGIILELECENTLQKPQTLESLDVLYARARSGASVELFPNPQAVRFYNTGATMAGAPFVDLAHPPTDLKAWADSTSAGLMGCFAKDSARTPALLCGFVTTARLPSEVRFNLEPGGTHWADLIAVSECEGRPFPDGARVSSERLYVAANEPALVSMETYASALGRLMEAPQRHAMPTGWCSWYCFWTGVTQEDIRSNLAFLAANRDRYPLTHVLVDDGYQKHWGDWLETGDGFPDGMKRLADEIREAGFVPGLWVAPFVASPVSDVAKAHPDWLVRGHDRAPINVRGWGPEYPWHALDGSHPDVRAHLEQTFRVITDEWGYGYLKLDAMHVGAPAGAQFHDPRATRYEAYRRGLEAIRSGCGESFILGCNAPFGPSVGLVDGMRVSMDVGPEWGASEGCNAKSALRNSVRRWFFHRRMWWNDPDCLIVRAPKRVDVRDRDGKPTGRKEDRPGLTAEEATTIATGIGLLGGMVFLSDDLPHIDADRAALHDLLFPVAGECARPLDLFENDPPSILAATVERDWETWTVVGVINWGDAPITKTLDLDSLGVAPAPARHHVFSLFERHYYGAVKGELPLGLMQAHSVRLVAVREAVAHPQLLASSLHLTQGGAVISSCAWSEEELRLEFGFSTARQRRGTLHIHMPAEYTTPTPAGTTKVVSQSIDGPVLALEVDVPPGGTLAVTFEKRTDEPS